MRGGPKRLIGRLRDWRIRPRRSSAPKRPSEAAELGWVRAEQIAALARQTPVIVLATLVNSAITVLVFWDHAPRLALLLWGAALWALAARQTATWLRRSGGAGVTPPPERVRIRAVVLAAAAGLLWGGPLTMLSFVGPESHHLFAAFVAGGMAAGAATTLATVPAAAASFIALCLGPVAAGFALRLDGMHAAMAAMLLLFLALMLTVARSKYADFLESVAKRLEVAALLRQMAASRAELINLFADTSVAFAMFDAGRRLQLWSANFSELAGCGREALRVGRSLDDVVKNCPSVRASAPDDPDEEARGDAFQERQAPGGRWIRSNLRPTAEGGSILVLMDVTDLKAREADLASALEDREFLLRELEHRVGNVLGAVQAIAQHTLHDSASIEEFQKSFEGRLLALGRAHRELASRKWKSADLGRLVSEAISPFTGGDPRRAQICGEPVLVPARLALALSMVLHELATNAVKHGAWRRPDGRVDVSFGLESRGAQQGLRLAWREASSLRIVPPTRRGFGERLLKQLLEYEFGAEVRTELRAQGLAWEAFIPWRGANDDQPPAAFQSRSR